MSDAHQLTLTHDTTRCLATEDSWIRILIGNIEGTNDIYMKREVLEAEAPGDMGKGQPAHIGTFKWNMVSSRIFNNAFSMVQRLKDSYADRDWQEAYIRFLKRSMASNASNYNMIFPLVVGFKGFQGSLPRGIKLFVKQEDYIPVIIEAVTPKTYKVRPDYDDSEAFEIPKIQLEKIAIQTWQMDNREIYPEFFEE